MRSAVVLALLVVPVGVADAHIHMTSPMSRQTTAQGDPQKEQHCGSPTLVRTAARTSTYQPGATITVAWTETIPHPGWFRISFQPNGEVFEIPPISNGAPGNYPTEDLTGMTDATTGSMVLKDRIGDLVTTFDVTLPNMECANCTLQLISVMTDKMPYSIDAISDDIYFSCADITLAANAPDAGPQATDPDAGVDQPGGPKSGKESGGCSAGGTGAGFPTALALLGLVGWRRRGRARAGFAGPRSTAEGGAQSIKTA